MSLPLSQIPVAILAGGLATRLRPITEKIPSRLCPFAWQIEALKFSGIESPSGLGY